MDQKLQKWTHHLMRIFNSILLFLERFFQLKAIHPVSSVGRLVFAAGGIGGIVVSVSAAIQDTPLKIEVSVGSSVFLSASLAAIGVLIMVAGALMTVSSHRAKIVYLQGLPFSPPNLADKIIGKPYSLHQPSRTILRIPETTNPEDIIGYINRDCEVAVRQIGDDTGSAKVFFAGLARVPCLFIVGSFESPRDCRRLIFLRGLANEQTTRVFKRSSRTRRPIIVDQRA